MPRTVYCVKLKREAEGLSHAPWPGELGKRIYARVSRQAWDEWLVHQTTLINEYRLNPLDPKARAFLAGELEKFLFEGRVEMPPGYLAPEED